jgi:gamma-glutamyltranspeptidase/glutathione hydrolase
MLKYLILILCLLGCETRQQLFKGGAVAADHYLASQAGVEILEQGGNAVDSAVATSFALSVVRPFSCGIGGGGFMLIDSPTMVPVALNYRETAPKQVDKRFFENNNSRIGGTAVGIPGTVAGLLAAHNRFGKLSREQVLAPAIRLAKSTFKQDKAYQSAVESLKPILDKNPEYANIDFDSFNKNIQQNKVLQLISDEGANGFYLGEVAQSIVDATDGHLTLEDLENYAPRWETPLQIDIGGGYVIVAMPPPSSGGIAIAQIFGMLSRLEAARYQSEEFSQLLVEAMKHAFADRAEHLADAVFVDVPVFELIDASYLDELASRIVLGETQDTYSYGSIIPAPDDDGTSHLCVVDKDGMMVSATETINTAFGSLVLVKPYGFMLNNEMDDFSSPSGSNIYGLQQSDKNLPEPGKRPLSSMSPTIVEHDGVPVLAVGASGGPRIISGVVQVLLNILWFDDHPVEALRRGRVHHQWLPDRVYVEEDYRNASIESHLSGIGYEIKIRPNIGVVQVIQIEDGFMKPACDPRKGGAPAGIR